MNPRYRRLLIPGLLVALLVIVLVSSLAREASGAESGPEVVSRLDDPRITESSGLALSRDEDDLAYTINDSGNEALVFAIEVSTGRTVGVTTVLGGDLVDTEALALDGDGTLWIADIGDNDAVRDDIALYALPEPGRTTATVTATRHPLAYEDGPRDAEALLVHPVTGEMRIVSKGLLGGATYAVPAEPSTSDVTVATPTGDSAPGLVTDGGYSADGSLVVLRTYTSLSVVDPASWETVVSTGLPSQPQGETLVVEASGESVLVGSEGSGSELLRVGLELPAEESPEPEPSPTASPVAEETREPGNSGFAGTTWLVAGGVLALLVGIAVASSSRRG